MTGDFIKAFSLIRAGSKERFNSLVFQNFFISVTIAVQGYCLYQVSLLMKSPTGNSDIPLYSLLGYALLYVISSIAYLVLLNKIFENLSHIFELITTRCFSNHLAKSYSDILQTNNSWLISVFTNDSQRLLANIFIPISLVVSNCLLIGIYVFTLGLINLTLTVFGLLLGTMLYFFIILILRNRLHKNSDLISVASNRISRVISIMLSGALEIKFYSLEKKQLDLFSRASHLLASKVAQNNFLVYIPKNFIDMILFTGLVAVIILKTRVESLQVGFTDLAVFGLAASKLVPAAQSLYSSLSSISGNIDVLDQFAYKEIPVTQVNKSDPVVLKLGANIDVIQREQGDGRFSRLNFGSLRFEVGKHYMLHGESGVGKSSIFLALVDLIKTNNIEIRVDTLPVKAHQIAENFLYSIDSGLFFEGMISENLDFFSLATVLDESRIKALSLVGAAFVSVDNLDKKILDDGRNFSKGERQRLSLARVLICGHRNILLMDEALTGVPVELERDIYLKLFKEFDTVISVSHRKDNDDIFHHVYAL